MALSVHPLQAQSIEKIKLKRNYRTDYLDIVIDVIGKDTELKFIYDTEHLHKYKLRVDPLEYDSKVKTVGAVLNILRRSWDMEVLLGEDGYIYIARDKEHLQQLQSRNQAATVQKQETEHKKIVGSGPIASHLTSLLSEDLINEQRDLIYFVVKDFETATSSCKRADKYDLRLLFLQNKFVDNLEFFRFVSILYIARPKSLVEN
jgi:exosome complex RNA-binding protein Rrp4